MNLEVNQNFIVNKSNDLVFANYDLSLQEQRIILLLCSVVQPDDSEFKEYTFRIEEILSLFNLKDKSKYSELPLITKRLMSKIWERRNEEGVLMQRHWIESADHIQKEGKIKLRLSPDLKPFLLELKNKFITYKLTNIINIKSKYSIRIFELLKSQTFKGENYIYNISLEELRKILNLESKTYNSYSNIKSKILTKAQNEINNYTDIRFSFTEDKKGKKVIGVKFYDIKIKDSINIIENVKEKKVNKNIEKINSIFNNTLTNEEINSIMKITTDLKIIQKAYNYTINRNYDNYVGALLSIIKKIKDGTFNDPKTNLPTSSFNNFPGRKYDYDSLEKKLLGWDND